MTQHRHRRKHDYDAIVADHKSGMSRADIRRKHGCANDAITRALAHAPAPAPPQTEMDEILSAAFRKVTGRCPIFHREDDEK